MSDIETFVALTLGAGSHQRDLQRVVMTGDRHQLAPAVHNAALRKYCGMEHSMFERLLRLGVPSVPLRTIFNVYPSLVDLLCNATRVPLVSAATTKAAHNPGFTYDYQFIDVGEYGGAGESVPAPGVVQNLGEAEFVVALFQYMRLLGYPADKIVIATPYNGQRALIEDVVTQRCAFNTLFGRPTVDTTTKLRDKGASFDCRSCMGASL